MNPEEDLVLETDSEVSEDEDYVPGAEPIKGDLSEDNEEGDSERKTDKKKVSKKRKGGKSNGKNKIKRGKRGSEEESNDDDEGDVDFVLNEKFKEEEYQQETAEDPEIIAAREKAEKERTDLLWSDFLTSVETSKAKKKEQKESGGKKDETIVTKVYDFAGERVEVREKVKDDSETKTSLKKNSLKLDSDSNGVGTSVHSSEGSSSSESAQSTNKPVLPRRTRISFLSGDPADIGLSGDKKVSAREGLANVLNALQARNKKLGTLEKSKLDWDKYKNEQNLAEELEGHTRSKNGFIDKQEFLQRADLRQFELEKQARAKKRRNI